MSSTAVGASNATRTHAATRIWEAIASNQRGWYILISMRVPHADKKHRRMWSWELLTPPWARDGSGVVLGIERYEVPRRAGLYGRHRLE